MLSFTAQKAAEFAPGQHAFVPAPGWHVPVQQMSPALTGQTPTPPPDDTPASIAQVPATHAPVAISQTGPPAWSAHCGSAVHLPQTLGVVGPHNPPLALPAQSPL